MKLQSKQNKKVSILSILVFFISVVSIIFSIYLINTSQQYAPEDSAASTQTYNLDFNMDGEVGFADFSMFKDAYVACNNPKVSNPQDSDKCMIYKYQSTSYTFDLNKDGVIDLKDFAILAKGYNACNGPVESRQDTAECKTYKAAGDPGNPTTSPVAPTGRFVTKYPIDPNCKAGYTPGLLNFNFNEDWMVDARKHNMNVTSIILWSSDDASAQISADVVGYFNIDGVLPVFRMCTRGQDCPTLGTTKQVIDYINKIKGKLKDPSYRFIFQAGPNEPNSEDWLFKANGKQGASWPQKYEFLADFANTVGAAFVNDKNVTIIGPEFNFDSAANGAADSDFTPFLNKVDVTKVKGIAGNLYDVSSPNGQLNRKASDQYDKLRNKITQKGAGFDVYIMEFGAYIEGNAGTPNKSNLASSYQKLTSYPEVKVVSFFSPFGRNPDANFVQHRLSSEEIKSITGCKVY
jgi:hypothetical protein